MPEHDEDHDEQRKIQLLVHDARPPFLDGTVKFSTQLQVKKNVEKMSIAFVMLMDEGGFGCS
jgi:hypothetical protein